VIQGEKKFGFSTNDQVIGNVIEGKYNWKEMYPLTLGLHTTVTSDKKQKEQLRYKPQKGEN
jgi:hypothetical protein